MSIEERIQELLAQAEPLRALNDDDPTKGVLGELVDEINALRAEQASAPEVEILSAVEPKRGPGRPKKVDK